MKRIIAALKGKLENVKLERKVNRVNRSIATAIDNAQDAIDRLEEEKTRLLNKMVDEPEVNSIINMLSDRISDQEEQEAIIERLEKIKAYINEDVEVDEEGK